jgi:hypothetical protein
MSYFTTSEINLYFTYNSAKRTLTLKDINNFIRFWHCAKQPYCIMTLSNSWHELFCFVLYLWDGRNKRYKATQNRKILMTTVLPGGLFEYTRRPIFVSARVHVFINEWKGNVSAAKYDSTTEDERVGNGGAVVNDGYALSAQTIAYTRVSQMKTVKLR